MTSAAVQLPKPVMNNSSGPGADRKTMPAPTQTASPVFPAAKRLTLSNGLKVIVVERHAAPTVELNLLVNTGYAAEFDAKF